MPKRGASHFQALVFTFNIEKIPCKYHSFDVAHSETALTLTSPSWRSWSLVLCLNKLLYGLDLCSTLKSTETKISATCRLSKQYYTKGENIGEELTWEFLMGMHYAPLEWKTSWKDWNSSKIQELKTLTVWSILWKQLSSINAISQLNLMLAASLRSVGTGPVWQLYSFWISKHSIIM
jgi:hypothetical protein